MSKLDQFLASFFGVQPTNSDLATAREAVGMALASVKVDVLELVDRPVVDQWNPTFADGYRCACRDMIAKLGGEA